MRLKRVSALSVLFLVATMVFAEEPKPRIELRVTPYTGFEPVEVTATVFIENAGEKFYCPELEFDWGTGSLSFESSDCDPYENAENPNALTIYSRKYVYGAGEHVVTVTLSRSGRKLRVLSQKVNILERAG